MAETDASFGGLVVPPKVPIFTDDTVVEEYLKEIEKHLKKVSGVIGEVGLAIETSFQVDQSRIINLTVTNLWANNIITDDLVIGSNDNIRLNGVSLFDIEIWDNQSTQVKRVQLGKFGAGNTQWGIQSWDAAGVLRFQVGDTTFIDGVIILNATILDAAIFDVDGNKLQDGSVPDGKIINIEYSKIDNVLVTDSDIVSIEYSKIDNVLVTSSDIVSITYSKITDVVVTESDIGVLAVTNSKIGLLAITNTEIDNVTIDTGKHVANSITDSIIDTGSTVTWTDGDEGQKTIVTESIATGGVDVTVLFSCNALYTKGGGNANLSVTLTYFRGAFVQRALNFVLVNGTNWPLQIIYTDDGTTGTHTLSIRGDPTTDINATGDLTITVPTVTYLLLKT